MQLEERMAVIVAVTRGLGERTDHAIIILAGGQGGWGDVGGEAVSCVHTSMPSNIAPPVKFNFSLFFYVV